MKIYIAGKITGDPDYRAKFADAQRQIEAQAYIRAFDRMLEERRRRGKMDGGMRWGETGLDVFNWWMENGVLPGQEVLEEFREDLL